MAIRSSRFSEGHYKEFTGRRQDKRHFIPAAVTLRRGKEAERDHQILTLAANCSALDNVIRSVKTLFLE
ncbi:hypothetical protein [Edaphovirga cremea]|uniref:hypothetical protein n=1 Tax=Edaphovirga cremea TaxID=2267246 RepID=UPI003988C40F